MHRNAQNVNYIRNFLQKKGTKKVTLLFMEELLLIISSSSCPHSAVRAVLEQITIALFLKPEHS